MSRPFVWGTGDCVTFIADWVFIKRGVDPAEAVRGSYSGESDGARHMQGFGGLARSVGRALRASGLLMTKEPRAGDVAVVVFGAHVTCAIRTARRWALRLEDGMALVPGDRIRVVAAWRV